MLIANGSQNPGQDVWCETITVLPNTDYQFAAWVSTAVSGAANSLPHLRFKINGTAVSPAVTPSGTAGVWTQFFAIWNSGANTSINICISDSNNAVGGNDFVIDDITFNAVCTVTDSVRITTFKKPVFTLPPTAAYCDSIYQILSPTMTAGTGTFSYLWTPNNLTTPADTALLAGTYTLAMHNQCPNSTTSISTTLSLNHSPSANLGADTLVCNQPTLQLLPNPTGTSPYTYAWSDLSTGDSLIVNTAAAYWVTVSNLCGSYADTINVDFRSTPLASVIQPSDTTICSTSSVVLSIPILPVYDTLTWQNGTTHTNTYTATTGGTYIVTVKNACGSVLDSTHVYIMPAPLASSIGPDTLICNGSSITLKPSPDPSGAGITFTWQDGITHTNTFSASQFGLYILQVSNACISVFDSVRVDTLSAPFVFSIGADQGLCTTATIELKANPTPLSTDTLTWQDGITHTDSFHVTTAGTYTLTESNKCGNRQASVNITPLLPPSVSFGILPVFCDVDSVKLLPLLSGGQGTLAWNTGVNTDSIYAKTSGIYTLKDSNNCGVGVGTVTVKMATSPTRPFNNMMIDSCTAAKVLLDAKNVGMTFLWSTGASTQVITADSATKYHVTISDAGNCPIQDSVTVMFHDCANCRMVSPTAFTPNGDTKNEKFHCLFECHIEYFVLKIYNRWGEKIYESYDHTDGWDGTYQLTPQPIGIYTYILQYRDSSMKEVKAISGNITLLR